MKKILIFIILISAACITAETVHAQGYSLTNNLWIRAVINTEDRGPIEAVWKQGGEDRTSGNDHVIWGYFYADPGDVSWGSRENPELFVKIWFDRNGRLDVNFFHVSVPDIEVYSDYPNDGTPDRHGTATVSRRYIRQYYLNGRSYAEESYENGDPPPGIQPEGNPSGYLSDSVRIGTVIQTDNSGPIEGIWRKGGEDSTVGGHKVIWGHFYADPVKVNWGSQNNPDLFVKVWFDAGGRIDVNFFHVSVPDIEVYSDFPSEGGYGSMGRTILNNRYIRHEYRRATDGQSPLAKFSVNLISDTVPLKVTLDASESHDPDGNIVSYQWESSPDLGRTWEGKIQTVELPDAGEYTFSLTVTDNDGLQGMNQQQADISWPGTGEFSVEELVFTDNYEKSGETCQRPGVMTNFDENDRKVIAWANYHNFENGMPYEFRWHSPDGALAQTDTGSHAGYISDGCSWASILTAKLQEYEPGEWNVVFFYEGQEYWRNTFTFTSDSWGSGFRVQELVLTDQIPGDNCDTPVYKNDFSDDDKLIAWAYYTHLGVGKEYQFRWYSPGGILAQMNRGSHDSDTVGGCAWAEIDSDKLTQYGAGQWKVEFLYDEEKYEEKTFSFATDQPYVGFEVTDWAFIAGYPGNECEKPASETDFDLNDNSVTAWVSYRNFEADDKSYEFRWYSPKERSDGKPAQTNIGTYQNNAGRGCSWADISGDILESYEPGQWRVEFYYGGKQYWSGYFDFSYPMPPFEVTDFILSDESPAEECEKPASGTAFDDNSDNVFAWVSHLNAENGNPYEFKWYAPDGTSAQVNTSDHQGDIRAGCSWFSIPADKLREYESGRWRVEFYYENLKMEEKTFTFSSELSREFEVTEFLFTGDSPPAQCGRPAPETVFNDSSPLIYSWLRYRNFEAGKPYEFRWYGPDNSLAKVNIVTDSQSTGTMGCLWNWISLETIREYGAGQWRTEFYYDGEKHGEGYFDFTSGDTGLAIAEFLFTKEAPDLNNCEMPASGTVFDDNDQNISVWLRYHRFEQGKPYEFRWYSPEGTLAQSPENPPNTTDARNGCLWESISPEKLQAYKSGQWRVEFLYDGQRYEERSFTFNSGHSDTAFEITQFLFTNRYTSSKCEPPASRETFNENDDEVIVWIYYRNLEAGKNYRFESHNPDNVLVRTNEGISSADISRGCIRVSYSMDDLRRYGTGEWRVVFYYDDEYIRGESFRLE